MNTQLWTYNLDNMKNWILESKKAKKNQYPYVILIAENGLPTEILKEPWLQNRTILKDVIP